RAARQEAEAALDQVAADLARGECFVLWPSGRITADGRERIGSNRSVAAILQRAPDAAVVLVRTRGLFGSMFGRAPTGSSPRLGRSLGKALGLLVANLLVLMPRRHVEITLEQVDPESLPGRSREVLNPFLEAWYVRPGVEAPTWVPYHFLFGPRTRAFPAPG